MADGLGSFLDAAYRDAVVPDGDGRPISLVSAEGAERTIEVGLALGISARGTGNFAVLRTPLERPELRWDQFEAPY